MEPLSPYKKDKEVLNLAFSFALDIIRYIEKLEDLRRFNMANQLFRCGTSIHV
jgi:four helix bundle protein